MNLRRRRRVTGLGASAALVAGLLVVNPVPAAAASVWQVASPSGSVLATVRTTNGSLTLTTARDGQTVTTASGLGLQTSAGDLSTGLTVVGTSRRAVHETYPMLTGKRHQRVVDENELVVRVRNAANRTMDVVVRAADDGVAFRYVVAGTGSWSVTKEPVVFTVRSGAAAWLQPYNAWYENSVTTTTSNTAPAGDYGFPALFRSGTTYTMLTESNVTGTYAGSHLVRPDATGSAYGLSLYEGTPVTASGPLTTPWRVQLVGPASQLVGSTLVDDLADPTTLTSTSWIKPGMSAWSWIAAGANRQAQADLATQERYVDLAAREGWPYMLVDDGWDPSWMPTLVRYAAARGVSINAWFDSNNLWTDAQMTTWFTQLEAWGVTGIKVDFMNSDSQDTFDWYDRIAAMTAKYQLMIDFHGATLPKGFQRTWPQITTYEAVRGEENGRDATLNTILPFTRNVVGSMDYTPTIFTGNNQTSKAHELAQTVVYESGWQHPADSPEAYAAQPAAADFLANVPTTWDDTRYVGGSPGDSAVIARRSGTSWFVGGLSSSAAARRLSVPMSVLGSGKWLVDLVTDSGGNLVHTTRTVTSASVLSLATAAHGGFALEACRATPGRTTCYQPVPAVTRTAVLVDTDTTSVDTGDVVTVRGTFVVRSGGPARKISLDLQLPETWRLLSGAPVTRTALTDGKSITGTWKVEVGAGGPRGAVDLPVAATFTTPSGRVITSADAARVQVALIPPTGNAYLSDLPFLTARADYGSVQRDTDLSGGTIRLGDGAATYTKGVVANANAEIAVYLGGKCSSFTATVGVTPDGDDPAEGSVTFQAFDGNGQSLGAAIGTPAEPVTVASGALSFSVPTVGVQQLVLRIGDAGDGINNDHGAFADAVVHCTA